jgi:hypothetical protein
VVNGNPAYQLYRPPYRDYYKDRSLLARQYGLAVSKRWVLIPENYRWAFMPDQTIAWRVRQGARRDDLEAMRAFAQRSLATLLNWCNRAARCDDVELILRPKPATPISEIHQFLTEHLTEPRSPHFHLIKDESVREWILASDVVMSAFSTTLIEAAIADRPAYMVQPLPTVEAFEADWYRHLPQVTDAAGFEAACANPQDLPDDRLKRWAEAEMLAHGDPLSNLADCVHALVSGREPPHATAAVWQEAVRSLASVWRTHRRHFFNATTHENDRFTPAEVAAKTRAWGKVLA